MITSVAAFLDSMDTWTWLSIQVVILAVSAWLLLARKSSAEAAAPVVAETADNTSKAAEAGAHSSGKAPLAEADTAVEDDDSAVDHRNGSSSTARRKRVEMRVIYGTTTGTARKFASLLSSEAPTQAFHYTAVPQKQAAALVPLTVQKPSDCDEADAWDLLEPSPPPPQGADAGEGAYSEDDDVSLVIVLVLSTWSGGTAPATAVRWCEALRDMACDFRVGSSALAGARYAVYGLGSAEYDEDWATCALQAHDQLASLGATPLLPAGKGDDQSDMQAHFAQWRQQLWQSLSKAPPGPAKPSSSTPAKTVANAADESGGGGCCGGGGGSGSGDENGGGCGCAEQSAEAAPVAGGKKKGPRKVIKGAVPVKRSKEERRQLAAAKGSREAAQLVSTAEATPEDLENDRLMSEADLEDSDADSDLEVEGEGEGGDGSSSNTKAKRQGEVGSSALANMEIGEGDHDEFTEVEDMGAAVLAAGGNNTSKPAAAIAAVAAAEEKADGSKGAVLAGLTEDLVDGSEEKDADSGDGGAVVVRPEMVTPLQRKALTKEGYKIIGSHSAVKLCRWTKHQLRGRGGCYKHTFYGITSYQCMEATPSLACANKCVFCWRHHKNPVGREWRWKEDPPEQIVEDAISLHVRMINEFKGAVGVKPERLQEAFTVRHCALSLVGEPIMYPHINELCQSLHKRKISTFLVTNAQFPSEIENMVPLTQLYVSIDAATKESLKAVDRPLFKDFWERFLACLKALKGKGQRTVYRLTLVKSWNMEEVEDYIKLLEIGEPDLIEIKAVTFCGTSDASDLTMENVPWHREVVDFANAIANHPGTKGKYGLACVHAHSCCTLLARKDIYYQPSPAAPEAGPVWRTWIDYAKFHELEEKFRTTGETFTSRDYLADTPLWALPGAEEEGFSPAESRVRRNRKGETVAVDYKSTESGCG